MAPDYIISSLKKNLPVGHDWRKVKEIYFYGAGCYEDKYPVIREPLLQICPNAKVEVAMDLMASARGLLGNFPGFAAILGTGTNSCLYDGKHITHNIDSLGFILGDEGSGGYMGKRLISDYIRGYMPEEIRTVFWSEYHLTADEFIDRIYMGEMPNRFCAGFTRFITGKCKTHEYLKLVVRNAFQDFFENIVRGYPNYSDYTFNSVGSIGWIFKDTLSEVAKEYRMTIGKIITSPMEGLIEYHRLNHQH